MIYHKPTGAHKTAAGVRFVCWHTGIQRYEWRSEVGVISSNYNRDTYSAQTIDGSYIRSDATKRAKRFRTFETAAEALVKSKKRAAAAP